ncbi:OLC1v1015498C1 [Oldenlandia corymbosa var. corymbosa]|uniref:OLC1v1015498C1 n=1 Tax=Oldenlandia corymbosa var. corymbosa TaxID=529605 RepID=A0AAV1E3K6_OLDCO|nr:OLC1v1015498C1 [Oldenlandia corymbosa var. corymbosa]
MREIAKSLNQEAEQNYSWSHLPQNVLSLMLYYLSPKGRCAFKGTCKSWHNAELLMPPSPNSPISTCHYYPSLMSTFCYMSKYKFYHPSNDEFFYASAPGLEDTKVRCARFGWLLMSRPNLSLFFYNPITRQNIELPHSSTVFTAMCFTSPPTCPDCQVFGISYELEMGVIRRGEKSWEVQDHMMANGMLKVSTHSPLYYNGAFYCLDLDGNVAVYHPLDDEQTRFKLHYTNLFKRVEGMQQEEREGIQQSFLLEDNGKLLGVFNRCDRGITVQCLDLASWEWRPVLDLANKCLFVSHSASFVMSDPTTKGIGNRVYLPKFYNRVGVFYCLDAMKYFSITRNFCSKTSYDLDDGGEYAAWIKPNYDVVPEAQLHW